MSSIEADIRKVIARHIEVAPAAEVLRITQSLLNGQRAVEPTLPNPSSSRFVRLDSNGHPAEPGADWVATYDASTKLVWLAGCVDDNERPWKEALEAAAAVRLFGLTTWRAPTIVQQLSIIDYERNDPAVDTDYFKGPFGWTWTSSPVKGDNAPSGYAWGVFLGYGFSYRLHQSYHYFVRAVCASQQLGLGI